MRLAALALLLVLAAAACGGDEETTTTTAPRAPDWAIAFVRGGSLALRSSLDAGRPITQGSLFRRVVDRNPAFSPNGKRIAFVSDRGEQPQDDVYVLGVGGAPPQRLTNDARVELDPAWRDDETIVFVSCAPDFGDCALAQVRAAGGGRKTLQRLSAPIEIAVRPGGTMYVYASGLAPEIDLLAADLANPGERKLTSTAGRDHEPDVSHEGRIVFAKDAFPSNSRDIYVLAEDAGDAERLTDDPADDSSPAWSPDGERVAWVKQREGGDSELWVMNADGSCPQALTVNEASDAQPAWDPRYRPGPLAC